MRIGMTEVMGSTEFDVHFAQFLDESENGIELGREMRQVGIGHFDAAEMRNTTDEVRIDGHDLSYWPYEEQEASL